MRISNPMLTVIVACGVVMLAVSAAPVWAETEAAAAEKPDAEATTDAKVDAKAEIKIESKAETKGWIESKAGVKSKTMKLVSGIEITHLVKGNGKIPKKINTVKVHYQGMLEDGTIFDSSIERGKPQNFRLRRVIRCWQEALTLMRVGGKIKLVCPPDLAYGKKAKKKIPANSTLTFEIELLEIVKKGKKSKKQ